MTEMEMAAIDMLVAPGGALAIPSLVISSMVMGGVLMWFLMRQERWKYESYAFRDSVMGLSMREMDEGHDGRRNFVEVGPGKKIQDGSGTGTHPRSVPAIFPGPVREQISMYVE
jgi:hypothetical protein